MTNEQQRRIDRMVDGELTIDQQRAVLLACEEQDNWRGLALAYVEAQTLGSELRTFTGEADKADLTLEAAIPAATTEAGSASWNGVRTKSTLGWDPLSLAAAILLSLGFGYGAGWWWQGPSIVADSGPSAGSVQSEVDSTSEGLSSMQFTLSNPQTNELQQIELPIVNASELGPNWQERLQPTLPQDLVREMRAAGMNLRQTRTVTPVRLPDGRRVIVPIDYFFEEPYQ